MTKKLSQRVPGAIKRSAAALLIAVFGLSLTFAPAAGAADGSGTGGGGGGGTGGGNNPLTFAGAYVTSVNNNASSTGAAVTGSTDFPLQGTIKLVFSLNVVDESVWPSPNAAAFAMTDAGGNPVPITVTRIAAEANDAEKTNVFITPAGALAPGVQYLITIAPTLTANNGNTLGQAATVSFSTQPAETPLIATQTPKKKAVAKPAAATRSPIIWYVAATVLVLALLAGAALWLRRKRS